VQTFSEAARRAVGRGGGIGRLKSALSLLGEAYGGAFAADIICARPFQDEAALRFDMEMLLSYSPVHVSLYDLTLEENTPLYRNVASSKIRLPRAEAAERLWIYGRDFLEARGYAQYEVSNFALPGKRSLHNGVYWRMGGWLGAGPSASGTLITGGGGSVGARGIRRLVRACVHGYVSSVEPEVSIEALDRDTLIKESFLMGFRCTDGPDVDLFRERFGRGLESFVPETLRVWRDAGKMRDGAQALNKDGLLMLNRFLTDCFAELDRTLGEI
jgi:oxygen-independent coproporphyrinogen-3 oxidase